MLKGKAKTDYQRKYMREYMRGYRLKKQVVRLSVRPSSSLCVVRNGQFVELDTAWSPCVVDADGNLVYDDKECVVKLPTSSHKPTTPGTYFTITLHKVYSAPHNRHG